MLYFAGIQLLRKQSLHQRCDILFDDIQTTPLELGSEIMRTWSFMWRMQVNSPVDLLEWEAINNVSVSLVTRGSIGWMTASRAHRMVSSRYWLLPNSGTLDRVKSRVFHESSYWFSTTYWRVVWRACWSPSFLKMRVRYLCDISKFTFNKKKILETLFS